MNAEQANTIGRGIIHGLALDAVVHADAAHVAHLVLEGLTEEADEYSQRPEVAARIRRWKAEKRA